MFRHTHTGFSDSAVLACDDAVIIVMSCPRRSGGMSHWKAMERWRRPSYLHASAGMRTVPVEVGRHYLADGWGQRLMPLSDFIDRHVLQHATGEPSGTPFRLPHMVVFKLFGGLTSARK